MKYYTIENNNILTAETEEALTRFYENVKELPFDYEEGKYKIQNKELILNENYETEKIPILKEQKHLENTEKAKQAIENGYVVFKNAEFETNAQTVGDLTATMLMMQSQGIQVYEWLSRDDKVVELTIEDFTTLGGLIAAYKNSVWSEKYISFKTAVEQAETIQQLESLDISYNN